jgi:acyl-CoA reductase-like NAD-dependent aldehyde dehydrogenase
MKKYYQYINGALCEPASGEWFESLDPYAGESWALIPRGNAADADAAVEAAHRAFSSGPWPGLTPTARGALLHRLGDKIVEHADELASAEVRDNGKLLAEMSAQLKYIPQWYYYYGGLADKIQGTVIPIDKPEVFNFTRREPVGVVAAITPWNSPLFLAAFKLAPLLAAGCTVVLKPSEHASASTLEFARIVEEAGFPPGVINIIAGFGAEVGPPLTSHPRVAKVSFTGSDSVGRRLAESAGKDLKRITLELGGKSPNIVFEDAEFENAINGVISGIFAANGQTCIAGSRLLVQRSIHDRFVDELVEAMRRVTVGNPMDADTQVGPIANVPQYEKILEFFAAAEREGAVRALGGERIEAGPGAGGLFVEPTIYTGVTVDMKIAREEVFGPILSVFPFDDDDEAIALANDTEYGLAAGVWTQSMRRAMRMSEALRAGTVWINTYRALSFLSPFGGVKASGLGRENGIAAIDEYLETKSVWISHAETVANPFVIR